MIIISMTDCPPRIRGDLSKWMLEIDTGVYVGQMSARVREEIWKRVCENLHSGRAVMVYSAQNEQHLEFHVHNTSWVPLDLDGLKVMLHPSASYFSGVGTGEQPGFSKASRDRRARQFCSARGKDIAKEAEVVVKIGTTGSNPVQDQIFEMTAVRFVNRIPAEELDLIINPGCHLSAEITQMTGITKTVLSSQGAPLSDALQEFLRFIGCEELIGSDMSLTLSFLNAACQKCGLQPLQNAWTDILPLAREKLGRETDCSLDALAERFSFPAQTHQGLEDCYLISQVFCKLKEISVSSENKA